MERRDEERQRSSQEQADRGEKEREREEEYAADAIGGRAGTDFDDEELDSAEEDSR
jgi:hypothetical protein